MSANLKISANTSEAKKSLLDLSRDVKSLGKTKISIFTEADRKFIKEELNHELGLMKTKLADNRVEITKLVQEQQKLERGSKEELETRKKIIEAYRIQTKLGDQMGKLDKQSKSLGGYGGIGGSGPPVSGMAGMIASVGTALGGALAAVGAIALVKLYQANEQFKQGASNRVRLSGLGMNGLNVGVSPQMLAESGMSEQDFIRRQSSTVGRLGREGGSRESIMQQARFERAYGLDEDAMSNVSTSLRANFGGKGADQAQMKLQASILASGIEDAIGPYLESATELLSEINKNGVTNTDEVINMLSQLVKDGQRTPEQIAQSFKTLDNAVKNSSGESNAFLQTAFARGGIGGGQIGATRLAMSSGGIFGVSEDELAKRGYNSDLISNMKGAGFTKGLGNRSGAILDQFKRSAGLGKNQKIGDVTDLNTMVGLSQMSNSVMGTEGLQGFDTLKMLEQVQNKQMSQKQFDSKVQEMRDNKDPAVDRLNKINATLQGQTDILQNINTNLMESLGKSTIHVGNEVTKANNVLTGGMAEVGDTVTDPKKMGAISKATTGAYVAGRIGSFSGDDLDDYPDGPADIAAKKAAQSSDDLSKAVETGMTNALKSQKNPVIQNQNKINIKVQASDGRVSDKTHK